MRFFHNFRIDAKIKRRERGKFVVKPMQRLFLPEEYE
jgi:hypothetical protein